MIESEKLLERKLYDEVKRLKGWCIKISSMHITGLPDRLCLFPEGRLVFVELKTTKQKPRKVQLVVHRMIRDLGFRVEVIDTSEQIKNLIAEHERI